MKHLYTIAAAFALSIPAARAQTLVAHYNLDSCSLADSGPHRLDLGAMGATSPVCTTGIRRIPNTARYFDGSNWLKSPSDTALAVRTFTISALAKFRSFPTENCQVSYVLGSDGAQGGDSHFAIETNDNNMDSSCSISSPGRHQFFGMARHSPPPYYEYPREVVLKKETWYQLTATYDGKDMRAYVNGNRIYTVSWLYPDPAYQFNPGPSVLLGSGFGSGGAQYFFDGIIDDAKVWDGVRTDSAIRQEWLDLQASLGVAAGKAEDLDAQIGAPYPSPAGDVVNVTTGSASSELSIAVIAADGRIISQQGFRGNGAPQQIAVRTAGLAPGIYLLRVTGSGGAVTRRFSKL